MDEVKRPSMPKRWKVHALAQRLWEQHGHAGEPCEIGPRGLGFCALADERKKDSS